MSASEIHFTLSLWQRLLPMLIPMSALGLECLVILHHGYGPAFGVVFALPFAIAVAVSNRFGVTLTETGLRMCGLTTQDIPWQSIRYIETVNVLGTSGVRLHLFSGKTRRLRAPIAGFLQPDRDFAAKADTIDWWWKHYTGQLQPLQPADMPGTP
jgi:hypothetical protein